MIQLVRSKILQPVRQYMRDFRKNLQWAWYVDVVHSLPIPRSSIATKYRLFYFYASGLIIVVKLFEFENFQVRIVLFLTPNISAKSLTSRILPYDYQDFSKWNVDCFGTTVEYVLTISSYDMNRKCRNWTAWTFLLECLCAFVSLVSCGLCGDT